VSDSDPILSELAVDFRDSSVSVVAADKTSTWTGLGGVMEWFLRIRDDLRLCIIIKKKLNHFYNKCR
jgi:hypothetical protein